MKLYILYWKSPIREINVEFGTIEIFQEHEKHFERLKGYLRKVNLYLEPKSKWKQKNLI